MKILLSVIFGFIAGVVYRLYYEVLSRQPQPMDEEVEKILERIDEDIETLYKITDRLNKKLRTLDDTQPVKVYSVTEGSDTLSSPWLKPLEDEPRTNCPIWTHEDWLKYDRALDDTKPVHDGDILKVIVGKLPEHGCDGCKFLVRIDTDCGKSGDFYFCSISPEEDDGFGDYKPDIRPCWCLLEEYCKICEGLEVLHHVSKGFVPCPVCQKSEE